jgi:hypothetical protein
MSVSAKNDADLRIIRQGEATATVGAGLVSAKGSDRDFRIFAGRHIEAYKMVEQNRRFHLVDMQGRSTFCRS